MIICRWFLHCESVATETIVHPVLGDVPACARCAELTRQLQPYPHIMNTEDVDKLKMSR